MISRIDGFDRQRLRCVVERNGRREATLTSVTTRSHPDAIATTGVVPDGHLLTLSSYENRVFQVGIEDQPPMVAKFYRPELGDAAISMNTASPPGSPPTEIPAVASLATQRGTTRSTMGLSLRAVPRRGGRAPGPATSTSWNG